MFLSDGIKKYTIKTDVYLGSLSSNKFYINSAKELDRFAYITSNDAAIDKELFSEYISKDYTIFIEIRSASGSDKTKLIKVSLDNNVEFKVFEHKSGGIQNVVYWYLVAIIPNKKLEGVSYAGWVKPSEAVFRNRY